ncbi:MAG: glycine zipper 2TM domain-containing protein [Alphaproteobacteria bacterium]|nr:glycine zipper 2TM domain-containing protein [Alphaproteobacteria bacterium]
MIRMHKFFLALGMAAAVITASPAHAGDGEFFGTLTGAALGGLVGNQFGRGTGNVAATAAGVFVGGLAGNEIGRSMDRRAFYASRNSYAYAPAYTSPPPVYYRAAYVPNYVAPPEPSPAMLYAGDPYDGNYCREYSQLVRIGNRVEESYGTACLQRDGSWRIVR